MKTRLCTSATKPLPNLHVGSIIQLYHQLTRTHKVLEDPKGLVYSCQLMVKEKLTMISTRGRYSIRILLDLAEHNTGAYIPIKDVAARQDISLKYIERIMPPLKAAGFIESSHGIGGGYRLVRDPDRYTLWDILRVAEGDLAPVACLQEGAAPCTMAAECKTLPVWQGYYDLTRDYFSNITLADLMKAPMADNYVI